MVLRREIKVPFSEEEIERLTALASAEGGSIEEFIRACVFGPKETTNQEVEDLTTEDLTTMMARLEGARIRARARGRWRDRE
jgi:hypothetical protein